MPSEEQNEKRPPEAAAESEGKTEPKWSWGGQSEWSNLFRDNVVVPGAKIIRLGEALNFPAYQQDLLVQHGVTYGESELDEHREHEKTRQLISEKLADVAQKDDLLKLKQETIDELSSRINELESNLRVALDELAKSQELEECANRMCESFEREHEETRRRFDEQVSELRNYLSKFAPPKRFFRVTFGCLCFFAFSLIAQASFGLAIVEPFWATVGVVLSAGMLLVIYFGMKDIQRAENRPEDGSSRGPLLK